MIRQYNISTSGYNNYVLYATYDMIKPDKIIGKWLFKIEIWIISFPQKLPICSKDL